MPQICPRCHARVSGKCMRCPECGTVVDGRSVVSAPAAKPRPAVAEAPAPVPTPPLFLDQPVADLAPSLPEPAPAPLLDEPATPGRRAVVPPPRRAQPPATPSQRSMLAPACFAPDNKATAHASEPEAAVATLAAQGLYESTADVQGWVERMLSGTTDELPPAPQPSPEADSAPGAPVRERYLPPPDPPMIFHPMLDEPDDDWSDEAFPPRPSLGGLAVAAVPAATAAAAFPSSPEALAFLREELSGEAETFAAPLAPPIEPDPSVPAREAEPEPKPAGPLARLEVLDRLGDWVDWGKIPAGGLVVGRAEVAEELPGADTLGLEHLSLRYEDSALVVDDLGAIDGVYRRMTEPAALEDGQRFRVGGHVLEFRAAKPSAPAAPLASDDRGVLCSRELQALGYVDLIRPDGRHGLRFPLTKRDATVIGREGPTACVALVGDPAVSTSHAQIRASDDGFVLEDLKSRSGTFLQLQRPTLLRPGDVLQAGKLLFRIAGA